ncbi:N-6 DNA methylase [Patescibacteria group bacterium]|nr:N-6 DNA methylase [Patescibacteria group bacterium]
MDESIPQAQVYLYLHHNQAYITLNTSGSSLHQRGRRVDQGEAPIKENLAVATLLLASWPFHQALRDPCCGSGTMVIEAARLAKNIAPGRDRDFAFQYFPSYSPQLFDQIRAEAIAKEMTKPRTIIGSDIDEGILEVAKKNAISAGVDDVVQFYYHDIFTDTKLPALQGNTTIVSNPPYGQRLDDPQVDEIHNRLCDLIEQDGWNGAVISGYEKADSAFPLTKWKRKETRQGKERCYIYIPRKL